MTKSVHIKSLEADISKSRKIRDAARNALNAATKHLFDLEFAVRRERFAQRLKESDGPLVDVPYGYYINYKFVPITEKLRFDGTCWRNDTGMVYSAKHNGVVKKFVRSIHISYAASISDVIRRAKHYALTGVRIPPPAKPKPKVVKAKGINIAALNEVLKGSGFGIYKRKA